MLDYTILGINIVLGVILIVTGCILISRNKNTANQSKAVGGTICLLLGIITIITRIIELFI